jgi:tryptophanyl-tRNA synthetase
LFQFLAILHFMRILSGIQPTGLPHLGNYFGMMKTSIELQEKGEALYFIADLHALTTVRDPEALRHNSREIAIDFLACGLDPHKACLFRQSNISCIPELAWILSTVTPMGLLERCHSYKEKLAKGIHSSLGLFSYPVLMAADILAYGSDVVPVGKDQKQHLEVTRDIAVKINELYGSIFKLPEPIIRDESAIIPGTDGAKMSKSYGNTIELFLDEKTLKKKIMAIQTDSTPVESPKAIEGSVLLGIYRHVATANDYATMEGDFLAGGKGYGDFKKRLFAAVWEYFAPMRTERKRIAADHEEVDRILRNGAERATAITQPIMERLRRAIGLI